MSDQPAVEIEYQTRDGDLRTQNLAANFIRGAAVQMYKRRTRLSNPVGMVTREGREESIGTNSKKACDRARLTV